MKKKIADINSDTISAIITPPGEGGLGAVRISGEHSHKILNKIFSPADKAIKKLKEFHMYYGYLVDHKSNVIDEVTIVLQPSGKSYTGQKQAEIFCHGGQFVLSKILDVIFYHNARPAEPGEFTRRAFLAGRIDLAKAEAVADLISSKTEFSYNSAKENLLGKLSEKVDLIRTRSIGILAEIEAAIDYPDEEIEPARKNELCDSLSAIINEIKELADSYKSGKIIKEGFKIVIAGRPNAGKSSLFNLFLNQDRAIVTPIPGTTRDYLDEWIDLEGFPVQISDTAGLREKADKIEKAGQISTKNLISTADLIIWIADISRRSWKKELSDDMNQFPRNSSMLIALNKTDKVALDKIKKNSDSFKFTHGKPIFLSCSTKAGYKKLVTSIVNQIKSGMPDLTDKLIITSVRHKNKLANSYKSFRKVLTSLEKNDSPEIIALEIRRAISEIDELTGKIYNDDILDQIFSKFCIGK